MASKTHQPHASAAVRKDKGSTCWMLQDFFLATGVRRFCYTIRKMLKKKGITHTAPGMQVVLAEQTADVMVLRAAKALKCLVVFRDGFQAWIKFQGLKS